MNPRPLRGLGSIIFQEWILTRTFSYTYTQHFSSLKFAYIQGRLSRHITSPSEKIRPESWPGDYMGKATPVWRLSCIPPLPPNVKNSRAKATANPVGGKACSSTKGGLLRHIPNTYTIHKVSSLKFAYFQGRLSRHKTAVPCSRYYRCVFCFMFPVWETRV